MQTQKIKDFTLEKNEEIRSNFRFKPIIKYIVAFVGGFFMMNPFVTGTLAPFGVSLTVAADGAFSYSCAVGNIIGAFVFFDGTPTLKYIATVLFCILIKEACVRYLGEEMMTNARLINAFASTMTVGTAIMLATGFNGEELVSVVFEALLCCGGVYFFTTAVKLIWGNKKLSSFTVEDSIVTMLSIAIFMMSFEKYRLFEFSPITLVFSLIILIACRVKSVSGGTVSGICVGAAVALGGSITAVGYALAGLLSGETSRRGKLTCAIGFIVPILLTAPLGGDLKSYMAIAESIVACAIFLAVPDEIYMKLSDKVNAPAPIFTKSEDSRKLTRKLNDASGAIVEVSDCVDKVQRSLNPLTKVQLRSAVKSAWEKTCSECDLKDSCRNEVRIPTDNAIEKLCSALVDHAQLDETRFPKGFFTACYSFEEMRSEIKKRYLDYVATQGAQGQVTEIQGLMSDQFKSMADILSEIACEFDEEVSLNPEAAEFTAIEAREFGLNVISSGSYFDRFGRLIIELRVARPNADFNVTAFTDSISSRAGRRFELPSLDEVGDECIFKFCQMKLHSVRIGAASLPTDGEEVCGDYYSIFEDSNGRQIALISDGMGTGTRAAVDSAMAAELTTKLIKAGLNFDCVLSIVNSALLVKSADESLATLDIACIDLYTGRTDFLKAGAASTFVRHKDKTVQLEQASLPMGILRDIKFSRATATLQRGDIILLVSDGVTGDNCGWIEQELKLWDTKKPADELASLIVDSARERRLGKHCDDMTAVAMYIQ